LVTGGRKDYMGGREPGLGGWKGNYFGRWTKAPPTPKKKMKFQWKNKKMGNKEKHPPGREWKVCKAERKMSVAAFGAKRIRKKQ